MYLQRKPRGLGIYLPGPFEMPNAIVDWIAEPFTSYRKDLVQLSRGNNDLQPNAASMTPAWQSRLDGVSQQVMTRLNELSQLVVQHAASPMALVDALQNYAKADGAAVKQLQVELQVLGEAYKNATGVSVPSTDPSTAGSRDERGLLQLAWDFLLGYGIWIGGGYVLYRLYKNRQSEQRYKSPPGYARR